jgi:hypothetical protein
MDSFKEHGVALQASGGCSGFAVLAIDRPGQYESAMLGIHFTMDA